MGDENECRRAAQKAMNLLLRQDRTKKELQDRLYRAGFSEEASRYALEYVEGYGYINDFRYAANYISLHKESRSKKEMQYKLARKGIPADILADALSECGPEDEEQALRNGLKKRLKGRRPGELAWEEKNKVIRYFAQKGYSLSAIKRSLTDESLGLR